MKSLLKYEKQLDEAKSWYLVVFTSFLLLSRMVCFVQLVSNRVNGLGYIAGAAAGGLLCLAELLVHYRRYLKKEYYLLGQRCVRAARAEKDDEQPACYPWCGGFDLNRAVSGAVALYRAGLQ